MEPVGLAQEGIQMLQVLQGQQTLVAEVEVAVGLQVMLERVEMVDLVSLFSHTMNNSLYRWYRLKGCSKLEE